MHSRNDLPTHADTSTILEDITYDLQSDLNSKSAVSHRQDVHSPLPSPPKGLTNATSQPASKGAEPAAGHF